MTESDIELDSDVSDIEEGTVPLKPGKERPFFNNKEGMEAKLELLGESDETWLHSMQTTIDLSSITLPGADKPEDASKKPSGATNAAIEDDFKREMTFYCQAQLAAKEALSKLRAMNIPTERPEDYFAEMLKTDAHMQKVRAKMLSKQENMDASEKAKKQRQMKKFGKKIQQEVLAKRQKEKKKMLESVDKLKKGKERLNKGKDDDDIFNIKAEEQKKSAVKRKAKDDKFGFGGKKRKLKQNTNADLHQKDGFNPTVNSNRGNKKFLNKNKTASKSSNNTKRLGKSRREHPQKKKKAGGAK